MSDLIIKDSELKQTEDFIDQFMKELIDLCGEYFTNASTIYKDDLKNSEMIEVIINGIKPLGSFYSVETQMETAIKNDGSDYTKLTFEQKYMNNEVSKFISEIDEIDSILY